MTDTMTDRELLELAALAYWGDEIDDVCSIEWSEEDQAIGYTHADNQDHNGQDRTFLWNPLTDDGDAFRLAVKLGVLVDTHGMHARVCFPYEAPLAYEAMGEDRDSSVRRAIVRAAAALIRMESKK